MNFTRVYTNEEGPYAGITWVKRDAILRNAEGEVIFERKDVEFPDSWSDSTINIVVSRYFKGARDPDFKEPETSLKELVDRVANEITKCGAKQGYFDKESALAFSDELKYILVNQIAAFNSPVYFNLGLEDEPQISACFINRVEDSMESILDLAKTEGMLFKYGSGSGTNFSTLRASSERLLSSGGEASGPVSFMRGFDSFAGVIRSGGRSRRAAKMAILDADHPDIEEFVWCKANEEQKANKLIDAGFTPAEAYSTISFQNANNSVRVSDTFMEKTLEEDAQWDLIARKTGEVSDFVNASDLLTQMSEAAWECGDPGLQFDTTINAWNTCATMDRMYATNPCGEFSFLDDSACNLASINLMKFKFFTDTVHFKQAVRLLITAQDILIDHARYPTPEIKVNSQSYRPLGLGYTNLGGMLMAEGLPYDSTKARELAGRITSLLTATAYLTSAELAKHLGAFIHYADVEDDMTNVIESHGAASDDGLWDDVIAAGEEFGFRNAQVTLLAPTGTISFMMDCATTGIEPEVAIVRYKSLVEGGHIKQICPTVEAGLRAMNCKHVAKVVPKLLEGVPVGEIAELTVDECRLLECSLGDNRISVSGHLMMMAAVQPFLSGAISKTVNLPGSATPKDIREIFVRAWKLGLKSVTVYRDGCKQLQPVNTEESESWAGESCTPVRRKLPDERESITHKFTVGGHEGYLTVGKYADGTPGEVFICMAKHGATVSGLMDGFATSVSIALQYGVPLSTFVSKFKHTRFEPQGFTTNDKIRTASSILDYIFKWLELKFMNSEEIEELQEQSENDAPMCAVCGAQMIRSGSCYQCMNCGESGGCG